MKAYMHRKGIIAKLARFLESRLPLPMLFRFGWKEIPITTSGTGNSVHIVAFDVYFT